MSVFWLDRMQPGGEAVRAAMKEDESSSPSQQAHLSAGGDLIQSQNVFWLATIFNHIKSYSELMVSDMFCVRYDSLSKALQKWHCAL